MNVNNMLAANKVKLHGMTSNKWTTKDKITQYKGLIKLYTRDRKIIEVDSGVAEKKQQKELKKLQKTIEDTRKELDNAVKGDTQKLRNTLSEHREMQMAYQYAKPEKVIEMVDHVNFNKRKSRDLLLYKKNLKTNELIDLKLRFAALEDTVKFEDMSWQSMLPSERHAQIITGKVQDAILKKEAAIVIRHSYKDMIAIMKKDALYFDAILDAIRIDGVNQGKCMINATKLGQLATEYLDDRRQEYMHLEKIVRRDLASRRKDLDEVQHRVQWFSTNVTNLLRRDSDVNLGVVSIKASGSLTELETDLKEVEVTLTYLKNAIYVGSLDAIFPCLEDQLKQKERLIAMVEMCEKKRDELLKKTNYAIVNKSELENTMVETTFQYKQDKLHYRNELNTKCENIRKLDQLLGTRYFLMAQIRIALKHLLLLSDMLSDDGKTISASNKKQNLEFGKHMEKSNLEEADTVNILPELIKKFTKLAQYSKDLLKNEEREYGFMAFEHLMNESTRGERIEVKISEDSLIETVMVDPHVLSRNDIKKLSEEIVQINSVSDDFVPDAKQKRRLF